MKICPRRLSFLTSFLKFGQRDVFIRSVFVSIIGLASAAALPGMAVGAPLILSDGQLDLVTAASATLQLKLSAMAEGPTAITSTTGRVQSADISIQLVRVSPEPRRYVALVGRVPATVFLAAGRAAAAGAAGADCSSKIETSGSFAYLTEASVRTQTSGFAGIPTAVSCSCAAFAISLAQR